MEVNLLVIHCSATPPSMRVDADVIRDWHVNNNGWSDIGYHYLITREGFVEKGRDLDGDGDVEDNPGAHAFGYNSDSLSICLIGGVNEGGEPEFNYSRRQMDALDLLIKKIQRDHNLPLRKIVGHNELPGVDKACPCFSVSAWLGL